MNQSEAQKRLEEALKTLRAVELPESLEVVAFERLLDAQGLPASPQPGSLGGSEPKASASPHSVAVASSDDSALTSLAKQFRSDLGDVTQVYDFQDGDLQLILRRDMLPEPSKKAVSMRHIGLLVAAGRQATGLEEWTAMTKLRDECRELGVLDSSNFSTEIGKLGFKVRGTGVKREVRATRHHLAEASDLLSQIVKAA